MAPADPLLRDAIYGTYREDRELPLPPSGLDDRAKLFLERRFASLLSEIPRGPVLELGCGDGDFLVFLEQLGFESPRGVDISASQVSAAIKRGVSRVEHGDNLTALRRHSRDLALIVARDVVEHYDKSQLVELMQAIHGALAPGGSILIQTTNADGPFAARHRYADFTHELSFTPTSMRQLLRSTGFTAIRIAPVQPIVHGPLSAARWFVWKAIRGLLILYLAAETGNVSGHVLTQNMIVTARKR